jgi:hypothetical protein
MEKRSALLLILSLALFFALSTLPLSGALEEEGKKLNVDDLKKDAPFVFLDCWRCDIDYIRTEITYVNYVRQPQDADIHILVTEQRTGSQGREYTMEFIGQKRFEGMNNTITYATSPTDTSDEAREKNVEALKRGLFPFLMKTSLAEHFSVIFRQKRLKPTAVEDPWNFWVFYVSANGSLSGEKSRRYSSTRANFSANRVTPEWKFRLGLSGNFNESKFEYDDGTIKSTSQHRNAYGQLVKSLTDHWSVGGWAGWSSSTYSNQDSVFYVSPSVEYNFFPYSESTRRQLRCQYRLSMTYADYIEATIYEKTSENLYSQSLAVIFEIKEPWGNASTSLEGSHFFHDFSMNRLQLEGRLNLRLIRGLSLSLNGEYSRIHDQMGLRKGDASLDEVLLRRTELATDFEYSMSVGLSYTFGSVYSNVVNPRFGR